MEIDHIWIVVKSMESGILQWQNIFGYTQMTEKVVNTRQKVKVVFMKKEWSLSIKLIEPLDNTSPVFQIAQRGGGLHHLCFKTDDLKREMVRLEGMNLRVLSPPQPGEAFCNEDISFIYAKNGLNIELIDTDKRANLIDNEKSID